MTTPQPTTPPKSGRIDINVLRELYAKATPGPWDVNRDGHDYHD